METRISNINFRGYDARPLKYIIMRNNWSTDLLPAAQQIETIGQKHGFKVLFEGEDVFEKTPKDRVFTLCPRKDLDPWVQDKIFCLKDKVLSLKNKDNKTQINEYLGLPLKQISKKDFVAGGNLYFIKNGDVDDILVGANYCEKAMRLFPKANIAMVPQADFHIDLFLHKYRMTR